MNAYEELNPSAFEIYFGGRQFKAGLAAYQKCAERFFSGIGLRLEQIGKAVDRNDTREILHLAHQLKGSVRMLGGASLGDLCESLEENTEKFTQDEKKDILNQINLKINKFKLELAAFSSTLN